MNACGRRLLAGALVVLLCGPSRSSSALASDETDTLRVRFELGAGTDVSNEMFYEDAYTDTTFSGRRLVASPETRVAAVMRASLEGTRGARQVSYALQNDLSLGDRIQRNALVLNWRQILSPAWRFDATPRLELRRDRSFDRDLEEGKATAMARARYRFADEATSFEFGGRCDFSRTRGTTAAFILDRNAGGAFVALDRASPFGGEWRLGYSFAVRGFPDSTERDHLEHGWEARLRRDAAAGGWLSFETEGQRRVTVTAAPTSRDNFLDARATIESQVRAGERLVLRALAEGEAFRYDVEDSALYFNYQVVRGTLGARLEGLGPWTFAFDPRIEALFSRLNPAEGYQEFAGALECEFLSGTALWTLSPAAGWRDYDEFPTASTADLHSSYAFYELSLLADQALPGALRVRANGTFRLEYHIDEAQNARSLYFSLDVRRLF